MTIEEEEEAEVAQEAEAETEEEVATEVAPEVDQEEDPEVDQEVHEHLLRAPIPHPQSQLLKQLQGMTPLT